jgi:hypothetical protein
VAGRRRRPVLLAAVLAASGAGCATTPSPPPSVVAEARTIATYSGSLRVSVKGREFRGRTQVVLGFRRPRALRIEIPGPTGPRLVAVANGGELVAVFPRDRAVFRGRAEAADVGALLGVDLSPEELIDLLVGVPSPRLRSYETRWGATVPRQINAVLADGTVLKATAEDVEAGRALGDEVFVPPPHEGFRPVDAAEARRLWGGR